jgi:tetraacyldisaccharide-1-P 4'-kinase
MKGWSVEEQEAEAKALWGDLKEEDRAVVCDDCFQNMHPYKDENVALYKKFLNFFTK